MAASTAALPWRRLLSTPGATDPASMVARQKAAWRRRPLILDDDGDLVYARETQKGPGAFLSLRMHDARAAKINSLAWCMMWGIAKTGPSKVRYWQTQKDGTAFQSSMPDPTPVITDYCRQHSIEVFGSIRMNDCHDAFGLPFPKLVYPLKVAHPEMLFGDESQKGRPQDGLDAASWSGLNFDFEEVRRDRLWWVENTARRYDLDGIDMNFFRMPFYFKFGEEARKMGVMTEFVREARRRIDGISRERGKTILLGARVPGTIESCQRIGFDIETWLRERLVDRLLTGGGYVCYSTPAEELVKLGHRHGIPVYPCINCPANFKLGGDNLRAAASNLWWAGADGIYLWNFQYITTPGTLGYGRPAPQMYTTHLPEIADPQRLKYLDKSFAVNKRVWEQYGRAGADVPLPLPLPHLPRAKPKIIPIRIGDDVPGALRAEKVRDVTLRLETSGVHSGRELAVRFNDAPVKVVAGDQEGYYRTELDPRAVKQGINQLHVEIARRRVTGLQIVLENVHADVRYRA